MRNIGIAGRRGLVLFLLALVGAIAAAVLLTRERPAVDTAEPTSMTAEEHAKMTASSDTARAVTIRAADEHRIGVTYAVASTEPIAREVRVVGQVKYDETRLAVVSLKVDGWVEELYVDFTGRPVRAGEPLMTLYSPMVVSAEEEYLLAQRLVQQVGADTGESVRNARELAASARQRLAYWDVPEETLRRLDAGGPAARTVTLRAPVSGIVLDKDVTAGERVMAGEMLFRLADLRTVWVEGEVFEQDLPLMRLGQMADAEFRALPGQARRGRIVYIYPTLDPETRTARVRIELPNADLGLKPGMYATLRFTAASPRGIVSVPRSAVLSTGERSLVFKRLADGRLEPHQVRLGLASDERVQVLEGISAGDTVVASGTFLVDAESNLGTAMGGMGDMPGMVMAPVVPLDSVPPKPAHTDHAR